MTSKGDPVSAQVQVDEVAHGGYEVVIRLPVVPDLAEAKRLAADIRARGWVELSDYGRAR